MDFSDVDCNDCGVSDWREVPKLSKEYPENASSPTKRQVFVCNGCDSEGKVFTDGGTGGVQLTGALRE